MKYFYCTILCLYGLFSFSQQDPQYTQYMYNMPIINPAYVGATEYLNLGLLYRDQWTKIDGAPQTSTFFGNFKLSENMGAGLSVITDQLGPVKETNIYADFGYTITLKDNHKLSFGIKVGATFHDIGLNNLTVFDPNDPFFSENINSTTPNIGAGLFYFTENYYAGVSIPNFLNSVHLNANGNKLGSETQHLFVTGGYVFELSENLKLKPSLLVKSAFEAPVSFDLNTNVLLFKKLELGVSYRNDDSFSGLVNFAITQELNIGYAYDAVRSDIRQFAPSSHEVIIRYSFVKKYKRIKSPRFF
ncbi:MAG: type IX secretion system membrane protein PorP/SprF [Winogradskyella sp.]|uniref:PorP/SprF family type IX secretion system membrane protein n=1 Tax=Winogradskyella sp. TaxID=1883156 RepID=UPI0017ACE3B9|nr:type IX secretion system membrane protein PorP/SprF [Winogradskyella sp.]MBT8244343.1 type IX secretion system membrane protein PorP/SprF [Winogradskyella sp.]NNK22738.1 type IX secretion system membrane protein PorP/SprF [Winogradskyella sp.]